MLDRGADDPRAAEFIQRLEAGIARRLSGAPEPMRIPLASLVLVKDGSR
ncbi:methyltransferase [Mycobacterium tuberculosis]|nr:methyltransferase [Mycobacterium tuberculosis]